MRGLNWQTRRMPLTAGLNQKSDPQTIAVPELTRAVDIMFDALGGFQTRYPYASIGVNILGGGTLSDVRRITANGDELLAFTETALYSWSSGLSKWVSRGTHLAVKVDERPAFVTTGDQVNCDRAQLSNVIVYTWTDVTAGVLASSVYVAAVDATDGGVILGPTVVGTAAEGSRPRVIACSTKILHFMVTIAGGALDALVVRALDPTDVATGAASAATTVMAGATFNEYYDACRWIGQDAAIVGMRRDTTTSYSVAKVTAALAVTTATPARVCDGPIAVSCSPAGTHVQVVRSDTTNIVGDLILLSTLADVYTGQAVGTAASTPVCQIAAAHRSTQDSSQYRCYAFWDNEELTSPGSPWQCGYNWVDTGNNLGTAAVFLRRLGVASRAFDHDGRVYLWGGFADTSSTGALQNTYFLYRDDAVLIGKVLGARSGGHHAPNGVTGTICHLPGVALVDGTTEYAWCGTERRIVETDTFGAYGDRGPCDVLFAFDSNEARRTARLGRTLYVTGAEIMQYDGVQLTEVGFHTYPHGLGLSQVAGSNVAAGTYTVKSTARWDNAQGEVDRSTTAGYNSITVGGGGAPDAIRGVGYPLYMTHKTSRPIALEMWRTAANPGDLDAPFYLTSSKDPAATGTNRYVENSLTIDALANYDDDFADATLTTKETNVENGGILENISPPPATLIAASDTRLFLAGIPGKPLSIWYSKQRNEGEVAAFNDGLVVTVPQACGAIVGLAYFQETLIAFCENGIAALLNDGFDNAGGGQNYVARQTPGKIGAVSQEAIAVTDSGIVFKSTKGWYRLNGAWQTEYIGAGVSSYDDEEVLGIDVVKHRVIATTTGRMLVLDTLASEAYGRPTWSEWSEDDLVTSCVWNGVHMVATSTAVKSQQTSHATTDYGMDVEFGWLDLAAMQAFGRVRNIRIRGTFKAAHALRLRTARDWWVDGVDTYFDDESWTTTPTTVGGKLELDHGPTIQQVDALKLRLTATPTTVGESLSLSAIEFEFGFRQGHHRRLPDAQRQ